KDRENDGYQVRHPSHSADRCGRRPQTPESITRNTGGIFRVLHTDPTSVGDGAATRRYCYICGCESVRRQIAEPLLLPVCFKSECRARAEQLPERHCRMRRDGGELCGAPVTQMHVDGRPVCAWHSRQECERESAA